MHNHFLLNFACWRIYKERRGVRHVREDFENLQTRTKWQTYEIDSEIWTKQYVWIVVFASFATFFAAFGIGANDVANGT